LRGRYLWASITAAVLATGAAIAGFVLMPLTYSSAGFIRISLPPAVMYGKDAYNQSIPPSENFLASQIQLLESQRIIRKAYESPEWKAANRKSPITLLQFTDSLEVTHPRNSEIILVSFRDRDQSRAPIAAKAVLQ